MRRHCTFVAVFCAAAVVALLATVAPGLAQRSSMEAKAPRPTVKVVARIREAIGDRRVKPVTITFRPSVVNVGTVVFVLRNSASEGYSVQINGVTSKPMGPEGGTDVIRVTFKRPGKYAVALGTIDSGENYTGAIFRVVR